MNRFGNKFGVSIFGESHGSGVGVVIDGVVGGIAISEADFEIDINRRKPVGNAGTPRKESDRVEILSGVVDGHTTGAPLMLFFRNENTKSGDYERLKNHPRPSHADFVGGVKFGGNNDLRGGGHFSGRLTLALVGAGVVAKKMLEGVTIKASVVEVGGKPLAEARTLIENAKNEGDSLGGVVRCRVNGLGVGVGEPFFDSVESVVAHAVFSIPAVKGIEFGSGFEAAKMKGSEHNDVLVDEKGTTKTNHAGGIVGGISNGNEIVFRVAIKPTASIGKSQDTFNFASKKVEPLEIGGRHDVCIAMRAPVVVEAATAIALCDLIK